MLPKHNMLRRSKTKIQVGIGHVCMISQIVAFLHSLWLDSCGGSIQFIGVQACQQKMDIGKLYICWPVRPVWACKCARCFFWTMRMLLDHHFTPKFQPPMVTTATHPTTKKQNTLLFSTSGTTDLGSKNHETHQRTQNLKQQWLLVCQFGQDCSKGRCKIEQVHSAIQLLDPITACKDEKYKLHLFAHRQLCKSVFVKNEVQDSKKQDK